MTWNGLRLKCDTSWNAKAFYYIMIFKYRDELTETTKTPQTQWVQTATCDFFSLKT